MKNAALLFAILCPLLKLSAQDIYQECNSAYPVCSNKAIYIPKLSNGPFSMVQTSCSKGHFPSSNGMWFKWEMATAGSLAFSLLPMDENDDLDFVLFKLNDGLLNCDEKEELRCMASGENRGLVKGATFANCSGATGLSGSSDDLTEATGCSASDDNFLSELPVLKGDDFALFVNNYYSSDGFVLEFTGTASLAMDIDGCKNETYETTTLSYSQDDGLSLGNAYPNPARTEITLPVISGKPFSEGQLDIIGPHGDVFQTKKVSIASGLNDLPLNIKELPTGVYFIKAAFGPHLLLTRFSKF